MRRRPAKCCSKSRCIGWKEYEMEVVRDRKDNCIIICSIENLDPMGVHTGDSITVAPAQTLTDKEYQRMRNASIAVLRKIGVECGGSNVQFALNPDDGRLLIIEMNPRVSRSSALASKATGFPIAKIAAKLAVGYTLDELKNDITGGATPASFEPTIDYVVTKIPRFTFEKFPGANDRLTTQMKSVGEVMAIGRTFQESLQKALRSLETGIDGLDPIAQAAARGRRAAALARRAAHAGSESPALRGGRVPRRLSFEEVHSLVAHRSVVPGADRRPRARRSRRSQTQGLEALRARSRARAQAQGFLGSPPRDACSASTSRACAAVASTMGMRPVYKRVDTCAAEFATSTAYMYSTYDEECEANPTDRKKIMILGGGPNRIGQGIEFDYCCVHAALALREAGFETIMVNCNPETVSTDYDTSDRLYFEPLTFEDVMEIIDKEKPAGVIVQYGGQTPLKLCRALEAAGAPIIGTTPDSIDVAEDRERFQQLVQTAESQAAAELHGAHRRAGDRDVAHRRLPAGRAAFVCARRTRDGSRLQRRRPAHLHDRRGEGVERQPGAARSLPRSRDRSRRRCDLRRRGRLHRRHHGARRAGGRAFGRFGLLAAAEQPERGNAGRAARSRRASSRAALNVVGLMNIQFAIQNGIVYILEVNPRASRTVPFVSKATGVPLAKMAARVMTGAKLKELGLTAERVPKFFAVKESVFPFAKFPEADPILGPEMKSTGEVMGTGRSFGEAYAKAQLASGVTLPTRGVCLISVRERDKPAAVTLARRLVAQGFEIVATTGTAQGDHRSGHRVPHARTRCARAARTSST